ncbi:hypothetical protein, partial [Xanthomonas albilineans]
AARSMEQQAVELSQAVALFKLDASAALPPRQGRASVVKPVAASARRAWPVAAAVLEKNWQEF